MENKASCENCAMCVPKEELPKQKEWSFPDEMECYYGEECYPELGHICCEHVGRIKIDE